MKRTPILILGFLAAMIVVGFLSFALRQRRATSALLPIANSRSFLGTWARTEQQDGNLIFTTLTLMPDGNGSRISEIGRVPSEQPRRYEERFQWHKDGNSLNFLYTSRADSAEVNAANSERCAWSTSEDGKSLSLTFGADPGTVYFRDGLVMRPFSQPALAANAPYQPPAAAYAPSSFPNSTLPPITSNSTTGPAGIAPGSAGPAGP